MKYLYSLSLISGWILFFTGCATTSVDPRVREAEPPQSVRIGVRKFDYIHEEEEIEDSDVAIREFESFFLPAMLASKLKTDPEIHDALFIDSNTHAVDFIIDGTITESNGRDLGFDLRISRLDGELLEEYSYALKHPEEEPHNEMLELQNLYVEILEDVRKEWEKLSYDLGDLRAVAYAGDPAVPISPEVLSAAEEAARVEREVLLVPLSKAVTDRAVVAATSYFTWQDLSKGLVYESGRAKRGKFFSAVTSGLMGATAIASLAMGYEAAGQGNSQAVQLAQQNTRLASEQMVIHANNADIAQNRIENIQESLDAYKKTFGDQGAKPVTVSIYGKVFELKGSQQDKLAEFHRTVGEYIRSLAPEAASDEGNEG